MPRNLLIVACLLLTTTPGLAQKSKRDKSKKTVSTTEQNYKAIGANLPPLKFYRRDGVYLTEKDLKKDAPLIIMLFNPTCDHCEDQTRLFQKHLGIFTNSTLLLMAADKMGPYLGYFVNNTGADNFPSLQIGLDSSEYINKTFRYESLPQINIYDKQRKLIKIFTGLTPIDSLQAYIQ